MRNIAKAFLAAGMGGLWLCAKVDEADTIRRYATEAGREDDLVVIDATAAHRFNILDYAAKNLGGPGFEHNLLDLMKRMAEAFRVAGGDTSGGGDGENKFFADNALKWLSHILPLLLVAYGELRMRDIDRFVSSVPQSLKEVESKEWIAGSFCSKTHILAAERAMQEQEAGKPGYACRIIDEHADFFIEEVAKLDNRPRTLIQSSISNIIYPFLTGKLAELFCTETTVTPEDCREGKIVVMDLPVIKYGATGIVAQTLFKYLMGMAVQTKPATHETRPCFIVADEAQFFLNGADADLLSTARSSKTCIVYITQDVPTYYAKLGANGRDTAESILSKFSTRIFHTNTSRETNSMAAELIGKVEKFHVTQSRSTGKTAGGGGNQHDASGGFHGQDGTNTNKSESTTAYMDWEVPPDHFATKLRTGGKANNFKVDGIVIRNARIWRRTGRHWIQAEFSQQ